jgi:hypothetical protein
MDKEAPEQLWSCFMDNRGSVSALAHGYSKYYPSAGAAWAASFPINPQTPKLLRRFFVHI